MKIAITGHTQGIGHAIAVALNPKHEIIGISKSTGIDITLTDSREQAFELIKDCDVFINNCYPMLRSRSHRVGSWAPIELLYRVHEAWRNDSNKRIFVIGSLSIQQPVKGANPYRLHKQALNEACIQLRSSFKFPLITTLHPGNTNTRRLEKIQDKSEMLDPADVARMVQMCLEESLYIRELTFSSKFSTNSVDSVQQDIV